MARPFAVFGFTLLLALLTASVIGTVPSLLLGGALFLCFLLSIFLKKGDKRTYFLAVFFTFAAGLFLFTSYTAMNVQPVQKLIQTKAVVEGELIKPVKEGSSGCTYYLKTSAVSDPSAPQNFKLLFTSKERLEINVSDQVRLEVQFYDNTASAAYSEGYYLRGWALGTAEVIPSDTTTLYGQIARLQSHLSNGISALLPGDEGAVLSAMVLGDQAALDSGVKDSFRESGVYHLFAVSGLHVSLWSAAIFAFLRKMRLGMRPAALLSTLFTVFYMALTGFSMSVLRAGIMMTLLLCGRAFLKVPDSVNSLGLAAGLLCLFNPMAVYSVSFLLTVSASLGIITLGLSLCRRYRHAFDRFRWGKAAQWVLNSLFISVATTLFTLPVQMVYFKTLVPMSLITNLVFIPLGTLTIVLGGLTACCSGVAFLAVPLAFFAGLGAKAMLFLASACNDFPYTSVGIGSPYLLLWLGGSFILLGVAFFIRRSGDLVKLAAFLSALVLAVSSLSYMGLNRDLLEVRVLDVGNGLCILVHYQERSFVVGCGGDNSLGYLVKDALRQKSRKELDLLIVPRYTEKESGKLNLITEAVSPRQILMPDASRVMEPLAGEILVHTNLAIDFSPALRVEYNYEDNQFIVRILFGDALVVITHSQSDPAFFGRFGKQADVLISSGALPKEEKGRLNVLSGDTHSRRKAALSRTDGKSVIATGGDGALGIKINENGSYTIRREA